MVVHHLPIRTLPKAAARLQSIGLGAEFYGEAEEISAFGLEGLRAMAAPFTRAGLGVTLHAPFRGLDFGTGSPALANACVTSALTALEAAFAINAAVVVFHTGFHPQRSSCADIESWKAAAIERLSRLAARCRGTRTRMALENVHDPDPKLLHELLAYLPDEVGLCIDTGHLNIFSKLPLPAWFASGRVVEVHLHDNEGVRDSHLEIGGGNFPFDTLAALLEDLADKPVLAFEPGTREASEKGVAPLLEFAALAGYR